ncbi:histidine phosphatase superfamily [Pisolithus microcarpus]|nr:histidine phosphatase superfamily [Pisolithus microcarpus]
MLPQRSYETVVEYFAQDNPGPVTPGSDFHELLPRFGLIDDSPERWSKLMASIQQLNADAPSHVQYKLFFLGRHGEGYHNFAWEKYGAKVRQCRILCACYWSKLNGDGELTWGPDPELTLVGEGQADEAHLAWKTEFQCGLPFPEKLYCSPLTRAIRTNQRSFKGLNPDGRNTTIVENIREEFGIHTCDKRRTRTYIHETFPEYLIEAGFTEEDELWTPDVRETWEDVDVRVKTVLDMIFENDKEQCNDLFSRSGCRIWFIGALGVIPIVIKATKPVPA